MKTVITTRDWEGLEHVMIEEEMMYFHDFIAEKIERYEKQYRTTIERMAFAGYVGRWNGSFLGGKMMRRDANPLQELGDVDIVEVKVDEETKELTFVGHHHDASHEMKLFFLTENKIKKINPYSDDLDPDDFVRLYDTVKPVTFQKKDEHYYPVFSLPERSDSHEDVGTKAQASAEGSP